MIHLFLTYCSFNINLFSGVEYAIKTFVGDNEDDKGHKRSTVNLAIKKVYLNFHKY